MPGSPRVVADKSRKGEKSLKNSLRITIVGDGFIALTDLL